MPRLLPSALAGSAAVGAALAPNDSEAMPKLSGAAYLTSTRPGRLIAKSLTDDELSHLTPKTADRMMNVLSVLPQAKEMATVAQAGEAKRGWYRAGVESIVNTFGKEDAPRFTALLSSLSPQTSVEDNLRNAMAVWGRWETLGRPGLTSPMSKQEFARMMGDVVQGDKGEKSVLNAWLNNSYTSLTTPDPRQITLSGPKVDSFMRNLQGITNEVTNDAWMARYADVPQEVFKGIDGRKSGGYLAASVRAREAAQRLSDTTGDSWTPSEVQETVWSWAKALYEKQNKDVGARQVLASNSLLDTDINSVPDFSALMSTVMNRDPVVAREMLNANIVPRTGSALSPMEGGNRTADIMGTTAGRENLVRAAGRLEGQFKNESVPGTPRRVAQLTKAGVLKPGAVFGAVAGVLSGEAQAGDHETLQQYYQNVGLSALEIPKGMLDMARAVVDELAGGDASNPKFAVINKGAVDAAATIGSSTAAMVAGGWNALVDLATGKGIDKSADAYQRVAQEYTVAPTKESAPFFAALNRMGQGLFDVYHNTTGIGFDKDVVPALQQAVGDKMGAATGAAVVAAASMMGLKGGPKARLSRQRGIVGDETLSARLEDLSHEANTAGGLDDLANQAQPQSVSDAGRLRGGAGVVEVASGPYQGVAGRDLAGAPKTIDVPGRGPVEFHSYRPAQDAARSYMRAMGMDYSPPTSYVRVDKQRARKIAAEFDRLKHDPRNPEVLKAYNAMIDETVAQYKHLIDETGLRVEFMDDPDTYLSPRDAMLDVVENNHMYVFSTRDGFGSNAEFDPTENPLLRETTIEISGKTALANDLFRVVHDYFGHIKDGVGFRADGEENAWRSHMAMYSPLARRAATTETRGQNSWLNYGPHGDRNRTAKTEDTIFADQKVGLLPQWIVDEGRL